MFKNILKFCFFEGLILFVIVGLTYSDLIFNFLGPVRITDEQASQVQTLSFSKNYQIKHAMRFSLSIESENGGEKATLLWPQEPFSRFLIFVPNQDPELNSKKNFNGRLVKCIHNCATQNSILDMDAFVAHIEKQFPNYKGKFTQLPSIILNTAIQPNGLKGYLNQTKDFWVIYAICLLIGIIFLVMSSFFSPKP